MDFHIITLKKHLWNQTNNVPDTGRKPWIVLGDLDELSAPNEKL